MRSCNTETRREGKSYQADQHKVLIKCAEWIGSKSDRCNLLYSIIHVLTVKNNERAAWNATTDLFNVKQTVLDHIHGHMVPLFNHINLFFCIFISKYDHFLFKENKTWRRPTNRGQFDDSESSTEVFYDADNVTCSCYYC